MGQSQSTPEKIFKLARTGRHGELRALLTDLARNDRYYQTNRAAYLECQDELGNTPLTAAAARGAVDCVALLLDHGANLHHQNRRADGGSALHEAVAHHHDAAVELLLRHGASPFTENCKGFTALDIACASRNPTLVRRLEHVAPFHGWLMMKVPRFGGLGSTWERRWCVICHRFPYPHAPPAQQLTHVVFLAYKTDAATSPACRAWLDGAHAREFYHPNAVARISGRGPAQAAIVLHRKHDIPAGAYVTGKGPAASEGYAFYLRPDTGSQASVSALQRFMNLVEARGFLPPPGAPPAGGQAQPYPQVTPQGPIAATPGEWTAPGPLEAAFLGDGAGGAAYQATVRPGTARPTDEEFAQHLQGQYDHEAAVHYQSNPDAEIPGSARPSYTTSAAASAAQTPHAEGSQDLGRFAGYPRPSFAAPHSLPIMPTALGQQLAATSFAPEMTAAAAAEAAAIAAAAAQQQQQQPQDEPSAPPLISLESPRPDGAAGAATVGGTAEGSRWWEDLPPPPTDRIPANFTVQPAPPAPQAPPQAPQPDDDSLCIICMDAEAVAGVLHGESVHKCLCKECAQTLKDARTQNCPMCRERIDGFVMHVY